MKNNGKEYPLSQKIMDTLYSEEAERALLGAVLISPQAYYQVAPLLNNGSPFFLLRHSYVWQAITSIVERGDSLDYIVLCNQLKDMGHLENIGGPAYLTGLINDTPTSIHAEVYAHLIARADQRRQIIVASQNNIEDALNTEISTEEVAKRSRSRTYRATDVTRRKHSHSLQDVMSAHFDRMDDFKQAILFGISTGFPHLDRTTYGLQKGKLYVFAGRPGMGKTALLLCIAIQACRRGKKGWFATTEMKESEIADRMVAITSSINYDTILSGLDDRQRKVYTKAIGKLSEMHLTIDDTPRLTPMHVKTELERLQASAGIDFAIVDYLQKMSADSGNGSMSEYDRVSQCIGELKEIARELDIPILVASQLNRSNTSTYNGVTIVREPELPDLRGSGAIEQDADFVAFLHGSDDDEALVKDVDLLVKKNRGGRKRRIALIFETEYVRMREAAPYKPLMPRYEQKSLEGAAHMEEGNG